MTPTPPFDASDADLVAAICQRISGRIESVIDHPLELEPIRTERMGHRVAGKDVVHISFRLAVADGDREHMGALVMPYLEAATMAGYHRMLCHEAVAEDRLIDGPDDATKEALRELGHVIASGVDRALAELSGERLRVAAGGPQGVRPDVRPAFAYAEGDELIVAWIEARLSDFPKFEMLLMLPAPERFQAGGVLEDDAA